MEEDPYWPLVKREIKNYFYCMNLCWPQQLAVCILYNPNIMYFYKRVFGKSENIQKDSLSFPN